MKKILIYLILFVLGSVSVYSQHPADSLKKQVADSTSVYSKLSADQIFELEKKKLNVQDDAMEPENNPKTLLIPIAAFGMIVLVIFIVFYFAYKTKYSRHQLLIKFAELGKDLPKEIFLGSPKKKSNLNTGIILTGTGVGLVVCLGLSLHGRLWSIGLILIFIGIGYLIINYLENKSKRKNETA